MKFKNVIEVAGKSYTSDRILNLPVTKRWFDMELAGVKKEDYRKIKKYWVERFYESKKFDGSAVRTYDLVCLKNGYGNKVPTIYCEWKGLTAGKAIPEWSDNWEGNAFIVKLGIILEVRNVKYDGN